MSKEKKKALRMFLFGLILLVFCGCALAYFLHTGDEMRVFPMSLCLIGAAVISVRFFSEFRKSK